MLRKHIFTIAALAIALGAASPAAAQQQDLRAPDNQFGQPTGETIVPVPMPPRVRVVEVQSNGFEWGDAGIGAAGMLGIVLAGTGAGLAVTHRRRSQRVAV